MRKVIAMPKKKSPEEIAHQAVMESVAVVKHAAEIEEEEGGALPAAHKD